MISRRASRCEEAETSASAVTVCSSHLARQVDAVGVDSGCRDRQRAPDGTGRTRSGGVSMRALDRTRSRGSGLDVREQVPHVADLEQAIERELVEHLVRQTPTGFVTGILTVAAVVLVLWNAAPRNLLLLW